MVQLPSIQTESTARFDMPLVSMNHLEYLHLIFFLKLPVCSVNQISSYFDHLWKAGILFNAALLQRLTLTHATKMLYEVDLQLINQSYLQLFDLFDLCTGIFTDA